MDLGAWRGLMLSPLTCCGKVQKYKQNTKHQNMQKTYKNWADSGLTKCCWAMNDVAGLLKKNLKKKPVSKEERSNLMWKNRQGLVDPMWLSQEGCRQAGSDPTCCGESGRGYPWPTPLSHHHCCCCLLRPLFPNLPTSLLWPTLHPKHYSWAMWCLLPITKNGRQLFGRTPFLEK